jgi:hypothetical protein
MSRRLPLVVVFVLSLVGLAAWASAQNRGLPGQEQILSGADIGFRVEGRRGDAVLGRLMVRVDGKWVEADFAGGVRRLH